MEVQMRSSIPSIDETADFAFPLFRESAEIAQRVGTNPQATLRNKINAGRLMTSNAVSFHKTAEALRAEQLADEDAQEPQREPATLRRVGK
jgi:hypothetical protein